MNEYVEKAALSSDASPVARAVNDLTNTQQRVELMVDKLTERCERICRPDTVSPEVSTLESVPHEPQAPHVADLERVARALDRQADQLALILERLAI